MEEMDNNAEFFINENLYMYLELIKDETETDLFFYRMKIICMD